MQRINNNGLAAAGGGGHSACASCKHQRKKCDQNCVLAQYFPANKNEEFQAVHKIFGVANVTRMIKNAREEDRKRIADSLIWEAICRQRDPILGSYGEYAKVFNELKDLKFKLQVQNQALQQVQGAEQTAWNNGTNGINKGVLAINNTVCSYYNIHGNGNSMYDRSSRLINYSQNFDELKEDRDMVSVLVAVQQQQQQQQQHQTQQRSHGVFDPHYCLPGNQWQRTP